MLCIGAMTSKRDLSKQYNMKAVMVFALYGIFMFTAQVN